MFLIAAKDLQIERRSMVGINQVIPFSLIVVLLFGFALDTQNQILSQIAPGLFWIAIVFACLYLISRAMRIERDNAASDGLLMLGVDPISIFFGKLIALVTLILMLEILVGAATVILFQINIRSGVLIVISSIIATVGIGAVGLVYGSLASDDRSSDSLVPLLVLPILAPIVIAATKCWADSLSERSQIGDPWLVILVIFAVVFLVAGASSFGAILED